MSGFFKTINNFRDLIKRNQLSFYHCLAYNIKQFETEFNKPQKQKGFWDNLFSDSKKNPLNFQNPMPLRGIFSEYAIIGFKSIIGIMSHQYFITPVYDSEQTQSNNNRLASNTANFVTWALPIEKQANFFLVKFSTLYKLKVIPHVEDTQYNYNSPKPSSRFKDMLYKNEPVFICQRTMSSQEIERYAPEKINYPKTTRYKSTDMYFIVSPYYDGIPLDKFIKENISTLRIEQKIKLMAKLAQELFLLHIHQHIHRDIKPGNYLVDPDTLNVMLIDGEQPYSLYGKTATQTDGTTSEYLAPWIGKPEARNFSLPESTLPNPLSRTSRNHIQPPSSTVIQRQKENNLAHPAAGINLYDAGTSHQSLSRLQQAIGKSSLHPNHHPAALVTPPLEFSADIFALGMIFLEIMIAPKTLDDILSYGIKEPQTSSDWGKKFDIIKNYILYYEKDFYEKNYNPIFLTQLFSMLTPEHNIVHSPRLCDVFKTLFECLDTSEKQNFDTYLSKVTFFELDTPVFPYDNNVFHTTNIKAPESYHVEQIQYQIATPQERECLNMEYNLRNKISQKNILDLFDYSQTINSQTINSQTINNDIG